MEQLKRQGKVENLPDKVRTTALKKWTGENEGD
jgi:hypothetical protein